MFRLVGQKKQPPIHELRDLPSDNGFLLFRILDENKEESHITVFRSGRLAGNRQISDVC
jgi:hypothetical protein